MEIAVLGPLRVTSDGSPLNLGGRKLRTLLAILACNPNEIVDAERLVDALWDGRPPRTATQNLRVYVYHLRRTLGSDWRIAWRQPGYGLVVDEGELDSDVFEGLSVRGRDALANDPHEAAAFLRQALDVWRGPVLADLADVDAIRPTAARLEERRLATIEARTAADLMRGQHADLVSELAALAAEYPLREHIRAQLMLALSRAGRRAEALLAFREARQILVQELGVEPGITLQQLHKAILNDDNNAADLVLAGGVPEPTPAGVLDQIVEALEVITRRLDRLERDRPRDQ